MGEKSKKWIEQAERDISTAEYLFKGKKYEESALFSQQSVEKGLKALIIELEGKLIKTHDLLFLAEKVKLDEDLEEYCKELSLIYTFVRYPDTPEVKDMKNKSQKYIGYARKILEWIKKNI